MTKSTKRGCKKDGCIRTEILERKNRDVRTTKKHRRRRDGADETFTTKTMAAGHHNDDKCLCAIIKLKTRKLMKLCGTESMI